MTQKEKQKLTGEEEIIKELCVSNGVSYDEACQRENEDEILEMFFSGFPRMVGLSLFPRLSSLTIVHQTISSIEGLESCPHLRELWVVECKLSEITGLHKCLQLQRLYLYDNNIHQIDDLEPLVNLQTLWLNNNQISHIQGLRTLVNLEELNLADNAIKIVGHSLVSNTKLRILNLSGNKICSFKEIIHLTCLPLLWHLSLADPQSAPNPLCLLNNFYTHVLYHMPQLQRLDTFNICEKHKDVAETVVMKKKMYYTVRLHCTRRQFDELKAKLKEWRINQKQIPGERIRVLSHALRHLESDLSCVQCSLKTLDLTSNHSSDCGHEPTLQRKLDNLKNRLRFWEQHIENVEACYLRNAALASNRSEMMVHFLLLELKTVGNIRFEEGNTGESWFNFCYDFFHSRFCALDYETHHITGIKINRIIRVHNRTLRIRFQDKVQSLIFSKTCKNSSEYLFYVHDPEHSCEGNEILKISESGFESADAYKTLGRERAVHFSNSISVCDQLRMRFLQKTNLSRRSSADPLAFRHGRIFVAKVTLGHSVVMKSSVPIDCTNYPGVDSVYLNTSSSQQEQTTSKAHNAQSPLTECWNCKTIQKSWYVFDHEMVLPEYIVDFEYITEPSLDSTFDSYTGTESETLDLHKELDLDEEALKMKPDLKPHPKLLNLDENSILSVARANILSQITMLNLHGNGLSKLSGISRLVYLQHLTVSFNELTLLDDISHMPNLEYLDVSFNNITSLDGLRGLGQLKELDLRWNHLSRVREEMSVLCKYTPALLRLDTRHNPWNMNESVHLVVLSQLKALTHLDGGLVMEEEVVAAIQMTAHRIITEDLLVKHSRTARERPRSLSLLSSAQLLTQMSPSPWKNLDRLEPGWMAKITALNLDGQRLSSLSNMERLVNLRWASFDNNEITQIEGLGHCTLLEDLSLNFNSISKIEGLCALQQLMCLSINNNRLQCLNGAVIERLHKLHYLSAESNIISSLHGLQKSQSISELYVGNNNIRTTREIYFLKVLPNLVILDLYCNPLVTKLESYRSCILFHLPTLKALDGEAVELSELEFAKEVFEGKLNADMVAEKLGHTNFRSLYKLDMLSCCIRRVDLVPTDLFANLHTVNLERNNLTSFSGLIFLPNIKVLFLSHNHIESILPCLKVQNNTKHILYHKVNSSGYGKQNSKSPRENLEPLMSSLEILHLSHNGISSLINLQIGRLTNLKALFLQGNLITLVEGLESLQQLHKLVLHDNRIRFLNETSFSGQGVLVDLHLARNRIRELSHMQNLIGLQRLFLCMNKIQDMSELEKLDLLPSLKELSVVGNPVAQKSLHRPALVLHLSTLQVLDGIQITLEERTKAELLFTQESQETSSSSCSDVTLPSLVPLVTRPALLKDKKRRVVVQGAQSEGNFRQTKGPSVVYSSVQPPTGQRIFPSFPNNRYQLETLTRPPHL